MRRVGLNIVIIKIGQAQCARYLLDFYLQVLIISVTMNVTLAEWSAPFVPFVWKWMLCSLDTHKRKGTHTHQGISVFEFINITEIRDFVVIRIGQTHCELNQFANNIDYWEYEWTGWSNQWNLLKCTGQCWPNPQEEPKYLIKLKHQY